jgi:cobalt-zinc-cadmium efflux system outer membrane protein
MAALMAAGAASAQSEPHAAPVLSLEDALRRAFETAPELRAARERLQAQAYLIDDAERRLNPTLEAEIDNLAGSGDYWLPNEGELAVSLSLPWERGGDRQARRALAERERDLLNARLNRDRVELAAEIAEAFLAVQTARAELQIAEERIVMLEGLEVQVSRRVRAARAPASQQERVQARLARARLAASLAETAVETERNRLASYWDGETRFRVEMTSFERFDPPGALSIEQSPILEVVEAQLSSNAANLQLQRARSVSDVQIGAEVRSRQATDDVSVGVRFSMPLQFFNANQGRVAHAQAEGRALAADLARERRRIARTTQHLQARRLAANAEIIALDEAVLPRLETALAQSRQGFERGAFSFFELFDVQNALIDARLQRVQALNALHTTDITLWRLTGARPLATAQAEEVFND